MNDLRRNQPATLRSGRIRQATQTEVKMACPCVSRRVLMADRSMPSALTAEITANRVNIRARQRISAEAAELIPI
jgi:hypothetical protein